jgi:hypothetical protein
MLPSALLIAVPTSLALTGAFAVSRRLDVS